MIKVKQSRKLMNHCRTLTIKDDIHDTDETLIYYALKKVETGNYLGRNDNYRLDRTPEFYDTDLKDCYLFSSVLEAQKVAKEYGNYQIREIKLIDRGEIELK